MARFRITQAHYLKVKDTFWEWKETDQVSGRMARKLYPVPAHLDPKNTADHNYPGEIIVSTKENPLFPRDYIFTGTPTPDMEPLDEEAAALMAEWRPKWNHPIESLPANGFSDLLRQSFEAELAAVRAPKADDRVVALEKQVGELTRLLGEAAKKPSVNLGV